MKMNRAILVDGKVVEETDLFKWAEWFENIENRIIGRDDKNDIRVSTVFLGLNHGWGEGNLWFETMIFGGDHNEYQERYETLDEALAGHQKALKMAFG